MGEMVYVDIAITGEPPDDEWVELHRKLKEACFRSVGMEARMPRASSSVVTDCSEGIHPEPDQ